MSNSEKNADADVKTSLRESGHNLPGFDPGFDKILQFSTVSISQDEITIDCPFASDAEILQHEYGEVLASAVQKLQERNLEYSDKGGKILITIRTDGKSLYCYPPSFLLNMQQTTTVEKQYVSAEDKQIRERVDNSSYPVSVIIQPDNSGEGNIGLYANRGIIEVSGLSLNRWIGKSMLPGWPIDEYERMQADLLKNKKLTDYVINVRRLKGGEAIQINCDIELIQYQGDLCRMVTNKTIKPR